MYWLSSPGPSPCPNRSPSWIKVLQKRKIEEFGPRADTKITWATHPTLFSFKLNWLYEMNSQYCHRSLMTLVLCTAIRIKSSKTWRLFWVCHSGMSMLAPFVSVINCPEDRHIKVPEAINIPGCAVLLPSCRLMWVIFRSSRTWETSPTPSRPPRS